MLILKKAFWRFKTTIKTIFWKFKTILKKIYWRLKKLIKVIKYYLNKTKAINTIKNSLDGIVFLSNIYPSYDNIYRNMFVHSRVKAFFNKGLVSNVIVVNPFKCFYLREYEGINIAEINSVILKQALKDIKGLTLCVHFLNRSIWDGVKDNLENNKLIIWVHGADIQPWWRRKFNYENNDVELKKEKKNSEKRMELWKEVFNHKYKENIHIVFVSEYSKNEAFEDYGVDWPNSNCSVIHNYINIDKFNYIKKPVEQRKKILTIKSFSAKTYANDITQKAIIELSKNKIFDDLEFAIYGDGARFEEDTQLLKNFKNVSINKKFLNSDEIAALHKEYGVFIATTRMDSQGVSRGEAMSSGLVPIANAVAAIPEFVDENSGMLVPAEDYIGVANAIIKLYNEPELFEKLSLGAAERVRKQTGYEQTIAKEIELIKSKGVY